MFDKSIYQFLHIIEGLEEPLNIDNPEMDSFNCDENQKIINCEKMNSLLSSVQTSSDKDSKFMEKVANVFKKY